MIDRTNKLILIAIAACLWANGLTPFIGPNPAHAQGRPHDSQTPILVEIDQSPSIKPIVTETEDRRQWYATPDWWVAGFTCLLFVATGGLWLFTGLMWKATQKVASDGEAAIKAANRSAKAAEDVLDHTRRTNKSELRAYLGIDLGNPANSQISIVYGNNGYLEITLLIKNFGQTPAFAVRMRSQIEILPYPLPPGTYIDSGLEGEGPVTINPGQLMSLTDKKAMPLQAHNINAINQKQAAIYFKGRIDFRDVFDDPRWVDFLLYSHSGNGGHANFWLHRTGNATSESS